ncbi:MAG: hypothetical protein KGH58_04155 [Candidatus Micrarchaeota archaeon]|nr:hypothetical protein [Candidatus Micrarchaeota archaeon]
MVNMLSERNATGTDASMGPRLDHRNRHGLIERILRKAEDGATLEDISKSMGHGMDRTGSDVSRLHEYGMLRLEGTRYATTDNGRAYASALGMMNGILDGIHHPDVIPDLALRIESLVPKQGPSIYDYGGSTSGDGKRRGKRDMLTRSRINITHDVLAAMASTPMTRNGIRKVTRFETTPEGNKELNLLMDTILSNKLITRANAHQSDTEAFRITDSGWKVKNALGAIIAATSS